MNRLTQKSYNLHKTLRQYIGAITLPCLIIEPNDERSIYEYSISSYYEAAVILK